MPPYIPWHTAMVYASGAAEILRRNLLVYGVGGLIAPFVGIKLIDLIITTLGVN